MKNKKTKRILFTIVMIVFVLSVFTETRVVEAGNPGPFFSVSLLAPATCPGRNQWTTVMVEELPKIGIGIDVFDHTGWAQISPRTWGYPGPYPIPQYSEGGFDILFVGWGWGLDIDMKGLFHTDAFVPNGDNFYQYNNSEMDTAINNYLTYSPLTERNSWAKKIQEYLYEDVPTATIMYPIDIFPHNPNLDASSWSPLLWDTSYQDMANWSIPGQTEFHYACPADFEDFHTMKTESVYDAQWTQQIYGGLAERTPNDPYNNAYGPYACTTYFSANGMNFSVQLDPNLVFADGTKCNASDIEYSYDLLINPEFGQPDFKFFSEYIDNRTIKIISEYELQIDFLKPYVFQDNNLGIDILPKHIWNSIAPADHENQAITWAADDVNDSKIMGIGPYYLYDYDGTNGVIHLKANPHWTDWGGHAPQNFTDIYFEFYSNKEGALSALAAGNIDMVDSQFSPQISEIPVGVKYELVSAPGSQEMAFNNLHPIIGTGELCPISSPESGKHIRKAMSHIIPRQRIIDELAYGPSEPGITPWPKGAIGFDETLKPYEYNRNIALRHMELAGYDVPDEYFSQVINMGIGFGTIMGILSLVGGSIYTIYKIKRNKVDFTKK